jgi:hypothetical protein
MNERIDEPVGRFAKFTDGVWREVTDGSAGVPLYDHPKEWLGLTDEEIVSTLRRDDIELTHFCSAIQAKDLTNDYLTKVMTLFLQQEGFYFARAIEEKLKEKNNP